MSSGTIHHRGARPRPSAQAVATGNATFQIIDKLIALAASNNDPFKDSKWTAASRRYWGAGPIAFDRINTFTFLFGITKEKGNYYHHYRTGERRIQHKHIARMHELLPGFGFKWLPALPPADDVHARAVWVEAVRDHLDAPHGAVGATTAGSSPEADVTSSTIQAFPVVGEVFGREDIVASVVATVLRHRPARALILGGPGIGKTTVSLAVGRDAGVIDRFRRRRWFVPLDDAKDASAARERIATRLGLDRGASLGAIVETLEHTPGLLVLDNCETPWEAPDTKEETERLLAELAQARDVALVVTMRGEVAPGRIAWRRESLKGLAPDASRLLFLEQAPAVDADDPCLARFVTALGGIPLALRLVARRAGGRGNLRSLWDEWEAVGVKLAHEIGALPGPLTSLPISIALSLASPHLTEAGRTAFSLLGQLPSGMAWQDREPLLGERERGCNAYDELLTLGLAIERDGRLDLLPPIRDFAVRLRPPGEDENRRWIGHYLRMAGALGAQVGTQAGQQAGARLAHESVNVDAAFAAAAATLPDEAAAALPGLVRAARIAGIGSVSTLECLAAAFHARGLNLEAARALLGLSEVAWSRSLRETAEAAVEDALAMYRALGDRKGEGLCLRGQGDIASGASDQTTARTLYRRARHLLGDDEIACADIEARLGRLETVAGEGAAARRHLEAARAVFSSTFSQTGELFGWAHCVFRCAEMERLGGNLDAARVLYSETENLCRRGGIALGHANARKGLGDVALQEGRLREAIDLFAFARKRYRRLGSLNNEGNALRGLGDVARAKGATVRARALWGRASHLYERFGDAYNIGTIAVRLARASTGQTRLDHAAEAERAWVRIERHDLVVRYLDPLRREPSEPGDGFEQGPF